MPGTGDWVDGRLANKRATSRLSGLDIQENQRCFDEKSLLPRANHGGVNIAPSFTADLLD